MDKKMTYNEAITELEQIVLEIEEGSVTVDELSEKVKRAALLLQFCQEKLTRTEKDVRQILETLDGKEE